MRNFTRTKNAPDKRGSARRAGLRIGAIGISVALKQADSMLDLAFMPATDYDVDGCYPTPAIGRKGKLNPGLAIGGHQNGNCRDQSDLDNTNAYSRTKCNNGWCAFMYDYYFEKDQALLGGGSFGHTHEWENIIVWVRVKPRSARVRHVSASAHGDYETKSVRDGIQFLNGTHPKMVYHKDGGGTHEWRFAKPDGGDEPPENHYGTWQFPALVSYDNWPTGLRKKVFDNWPGHGGEGIYPRIQNRHFENALAQAKPDGIAFRPYAK